MEYEFDFKEEDIDHKFNGGRLFVKVDDDRNIWSEITREDIVKLARIFRLTADEYEQSITTG